MYAALQRPIGERERAFCRSRLAVAWYRCEKKVVWRLSRISAVIVVFVFMVFVFMVRTVRLIITVAVWQSRRGKMTWPREGMHGGRDGRRTHIVGRY